MAILGAGGDFQLSTDGVTFNSVGTVTQGAAPNIKVKSVQTSGLQTNPQFHTKMPGFGDGGQIKFTVVFSKAQIATLYATIRILIWVKVLYSDLGSTASQWLCQGFFVDITQPIPLDDMVVADFTFECTGKPTYTAGT
jgi:hypothetical protein